MPIIKKPTLMFGCVSSRTVRNIGAVFAIGGSSMATLASYVEEKKNEQPVPVVQHDPRCGERTSGYVYDDQGRMIADCARGATQATSSAKP